MRNTPIRYQASYFCSTQDLSLKGDYVAKLTQLYAKFDFYPSTFQELSANASLLPRIRMASLTNEWGIDFGSTRIDIEKNMLDAQASNMGSPRDFSIQAVDLLKIFLGAFPRQASRLSFVSRRMLPVEDDTLLAKSFERLFNPLPFYKKNRPFEWVNRSTAETEWDIKGKKEKLNVVTTLSRATALMGMQTRMETFNRLFIDLDINTKMELGETRFDVEKLEQFYPHVISIADEIDAQTDNVLK